VQGHGASLAQAAEPAETCLGAIHRLRLQAPPALAPTPPTS
jgi:hypothetical protein